MSKGLVVGITTATLGVAAVGAGYGIRLCSSLMHDEAEKYGKDLEDKIEDLLKAHKTISDAADKAIARSDLMAKEMLDLKVEADRINNENTKLIDSAEYWIDLCKSLNSKLKTYETEVIEKMSENEVSKLENKVDDLKVRIFDLRNMALFNEDIKVRDLAVNNICDELITIVSYMAEKNVDAGMIIEFMNEFKEAMASMGALIDYSSDEK